MPPYDWLVLTPPMKNTLKKIIGSVGLAVAAFGFAVPALAASATIDCGASGQTVTNGQNVPTCDITTSDAAFHEVYLKNNANSELALMGGWTDGDTSSGFPIAGFATTPSAGNTINVCINNQPAGIDGTANEADATCWSSHFTIAAPAPVANMDSSYLASGITDKADEFATQYGPVVLTVIGIALGLYGLRFALQYFKNTVKNNNREGAKRILKANGITPEDER